MKRVGIFFALLISFGLFLSPEYSNAADTQTPNGATFTEQANTFYGQLLTEITDLYVTANSLTRPTEKNLANTTLNNAKEALINGYTVSQRQLSDLAKLQGAVTNARSIIAIAQADAQKPGSGATTELKDFFRNALGKIDSSRISLNGKTLDNSARAEKGFNDAMNGKKCTLNNWTVFDCLDEFFSDFIKITLLKFAGWFLWMAAQILDYSIRMGILHFSSWAPEFIYPLWQTVRQVVSLCVVFAGLYMSAMYIINNEKGQNFIKRYLPWLVIFALFVNFSYPISRALIDISNVISLNIYSQTVGEGALGENSKNSAGFKIMERLGLQNLLMNVTATNIDAETITDQINSVPAALLAVAMVFYTAYIFGFAALLMIARNLILVFGIIGSPLLFIDQVVPKLGEQASKFRSLFFSQLIMAPVFMVMLYLSIRVMEIFSSGKSNIFSAASGSTPNVVVFLNILMMLGTLHIMLKVVRSLSGGIGEGIEGYYKMAAMGLAGGAGGLALRGGAAGFGALGRSTIGNMASGMAESNWMQNNRGGFIGEKLYGLSKGVADSTFDYRNSKVVQKNLSKYNMNAGKGVGSIGERQKDFAEKYNSMNEVARAKFADRTLSSIDGQGAKVAGVTLYDNAKGEDRQKLYEAQTSEDKMKLMEKDMIKAKEIDHVVEAYDNMEGGARQRYFKKQSGTTKEVLKNLDEASAKSNITAPTNNSTAPKIIGVQASKPNSEEAPKIIVPLSVGNGPRKEVASSLDHSPTPDGEASHKIIIGDGLGDMLKTGTNG